MAIARAEYTIVDLNDIWPSPVPPTEIPPVGFQWRNTSEVPNELLVWGGKGTQVDRVYSTSKTGSVVIIEDLFDNRAFNMVASNLARQAGSGTPTPSNIRAISGNGNAKVTRCSKNLVGSSDLTTDLTGWKNTGATVSGGATTIVGKDEAPGYNDVSTDTPFYMPIIGGTGYTFSVSVNAMVGNCRFFALTYDASGAQVGGDNQTIITATGRFSKAFTPPAGTVRCRVFLRAHGSTSSLKVNNPQLEVGSVATPYVPYVGEAYNLAPDSPLYGLPGFSDEIGTDGHVTHRTKFISLTGLEIISGPYNGASGWYQYNLNLTSSGFPAGAYPSTEMISSHFLQGSVGGSAYNAMVYTDNTTMLFRTQHATLAEFKAWLTAQKNAGTPVQMCYHLKTHVTSQVATVQARGGAGISIVASDVTSISVGYLGSGWISMGAAYRVVVNSVDISPELGLRIDQYIDGHISKTYMLANAVDLGFYSTANNKRFAGIGYDDVDAEGFLEATQLRHPDAPAGHRFRMATRNMSILVGGPGGTGEVVSVPVLSAYYGGTETGGVFSYINPAGEKYFEVFTRGEWAINSRAMGADDPCGSISGSRYVVDEFGATRECLFAEGAMLPFTDNDHNLGHTAYRWKKVYSYSSTISTSDEREKHDIHLADPEMLRKFIMALDIDWFRLNDLPDEQMIGFIAQKFREAMRKAGMPDDYGGYLDELPDHSRLAIRYEQTIAPMAAVLQLHERENKARDKLIKRQDRQLKQQGRQIEELKRQLEELAGRLG